MRNITRYDFEELAKAAIYTPGRRTILDLAKWFELYNGDDGWNGEFYSFDFDYFGDKINHTLRPVFCETLDETDCFPIIGWELNWHFASVVPDEAEKLAEEICEFLDESSEIEVDMAEEIRLKKDCNWVEDSLDETAYFEEGAKAEEAQKLLDRLRKAMDKKEG